MIFSDWSEALPLGFRVGRALARRCPLPIDVESVVMEALWKAQAAGAVFSKGYVYLRATGAVRDEMRRVGEGQRGNYQSVNLFVDVHEHANWIADEETDLDERIDRQRLLDSMPDAARELVARLADGEQTQEIAADLGVSAGRISQVTCLLKTNPHAVQRLPGHVDYYEQMRRAHRRMVQDAYARTGTVTGVAALLDTSLANASRWVNTRSLVRVPRPDRFPAMRRVAERLTRAAFMRANGSPQTAGRLLGTDNHAASTLAKLYAPELLKTNRRPDITAEQLARLHRKGWSQERIAAHLQVGESTVARRFQRASIGTLLKTRPELPDSAFAELRDQGLKHREIADQLEVSMATVCKRLARAKQVAP